MKKNAVLCLLLAIAVLVPATACGRLQTPVSAENNKSTVQMTSSDFKFEPNNITTRAGNTVTFRIRNVSNTLHNFTLKGLDGQTMQSVNIPAGETVEVKATFPQAGTYRFYCNRAGHSELGMKGQITATAP